MKKIIMKRIDGEFKNWYFAGVKVVEIPSTSRVVAYSNTIETRIEYTRNKEKAWASCIEKKNPFKNTKILSVWELLNRAYTPLEAQRIFDWFESIVLEEVKDERI